jgi:hypothetical protein
MTQLEALNVLPLLSADRNYIRDKLGGRPSMERADLLAGYRMAWEEGARGQPEARRDNAGRAAANTWLRQIVEGRLAAEAHNRRKREAER